MRSTSRSVKQSATTSSRCFSQKPRNFLCHFVASRKLRSYENQDAWLRAHDSRNRECRAGATNQERRP